MCGRYVLKSPIDEIRRIFATLGAVPNFPPTWNMAPTQQAPVVRRHPETGERRLDLLRWGLVPHFVKDPGDTHQRNRGQRADVSLRHAPPPLPGAGGCLL